MQGKIKLPWSAAEREVLLESTVHTGYDEQAEHIEILQKSARFIRNSNNGVLETEFLQ